MTALPPLANTPLDAMMANVVSAYNVCLTFQNWADARDDPSALLHARVLGYLILHTTARPGTLGEVVKVIQSCAQDFHKLSPLGESFITYLIVPFKKFKGRTPASSDQPSRNSFERLKTNLLEAPQDHNDAKNQALIRDGFRCVVSGVYDEEALTELGLTDEQALAQGGTVYTQCAHILPEFTCFGIQKGVVTEDKRDYASSVLAVLQSFGSDIEEINGVKVHSLFNIMTLQADRHDWFDRLEMWFEKLGENRYKVCSNKRGHRLPHPEITFTTPDPEHLPVPSEDLLELHAVCCKVAHFSGAGQYIEKIWSDVEDLGVLAEDGGSETVLNSALLNQMHMHRLSEDGRN